MISNIGWQSLEERGAIARLALMYKIVHSVVDISTSPLLPRGRQSRHHTSSETQGQIVGARESLNGRKNKARRKVKNGQKSP